MGILRPYYIIAMRQVEQGGLQVDMCLVVHDKVWPKVVMRAIPTLVCIVVEFNMYSDALY